MKKPRPIVGIAFSVWLILGAVGTISDSYARSDSISGFRRSIAWVAADGTPVGTGLIVSRVDDETLRSRFLVEGPKDRRWILDEVVDGRSGTIRSRVTDDEIGWWLEIWTDERVESPDLKSFFVSIHEQPVGYERAIRLTSSTGVHLELEASREDPSASGEPWLTRYLEEHPETLRQLGTPGAVLRGLGFWRLACVEREEGREVPVPYGCSLAMRPAVVLARALGDEDRNADLAPDQGPLTYHEGEIRKWSVFSTPEELELASRFQRIDITNPLAELASATEALKEGSSEEPERTEGAASDRPSQLRVPLDRPKGR